MAFASINDVKRILRIDPEIVDIERDKRLRQAIRAVESTMLPRLKKLDLPGDQMETFFDIPEDHTLRLPADDVTVTKVKVYEYPSSYGIPLSPIELGLGHGFDLTDDGAVILRPTLSFSPFEGATAQRRLRAYARVEVHYISTGVIPSAVTEGIAFLAAGWYQDGPRALSGLTDEKIGDYSYHLGGAVDEQTGMPNFIARAMWMLDPYMRKSRVQVI